MQNLTVTHRVHIQCDLTPEQWAMYDRAGARKAAKEINRAVEQIINDGSTRAEAVQRIYALLDVYSDFGVDDTEGRVVASQIIHLAYPTKD